MASEGGFTMAENIIDFDPPSGQNDPTIQADVAAATSRIASLNARAVMPDGRALSRSEILQALGLNPNTSPTAWLAVVGCGSNASALLPGDLQRIAVNRLSNASTILRQVQDVTGGSASGGGQGFVSGGGAPS